MSIPQYLDGLTSTIFSPPTLNTFKYYSIYYVYICLGSLFIPAKTVKGHPNPKRGPQLTYSINGFRLTILTITLILLFGGLIPQFKDFQLFHIRLLVDNFWGLWSTVNLFAIAVSVLLYLKGTLGKSFFGQIVDRHTHGSFGLDFWVGKQLNPRLGSFDIKFIAYRVAMIFWLVLNFSFLAKQLQERQVTMRMICYQFVTGFYVLDYFWNEEKMLTTWDIISEQFGYMLVFGDYVFIPFVFSVQCHYLLQYPEFSSIYQVPLILVIYFIGFYIFRTANSQKNQFKTEPTKKIWQKTPQLIGGKLLVSGMWGIGRHMNYTGDLIMAIAYCLPCGSQIGGYTYAIYLFILLTHRAYRDDTKCKNKYGSIWKEYCEKVPYVYVPFFPVDWICQTVGKTLYWITNREEMKQKKKQ